MAQSVSESPMLTASEAASLAGVAPATWRGQVARGQAPQPDDPDSDRPANRRTPRWRRATIDTYLANRPGQGARTDRPRPEWRYGAALGAVSLAADLVDATLHTHDARDRYDTVEPVHLDQPAVMTRLVREMATQWRRQLVRARVGEAIQSEVGQLLAEINRIPASLPDRLSLEQQATVLLGYHHRRSDRGRAVGKP